MKNCSLIIIEDEVDLLTLYHEVATLYFDQVYMSSSLKEARDYCHRHLPSAIVIDNNLPDGIGIDLLEEYPNIPSLVISGNTSARIMQKAIELSVYKYLIKPEDLNNLHNIFKNFREYVEGHQVSQDKMKYVDLSQESEQFMVEKFKLTKRELSIVQTSLISESNQEIAERLKISPETVKKHWKNIFNKTNLRSRKAIHHFIYGLNQENSN